MNSPKLALQRVKACIEDGYTHPLYEETQEILKASLEIHADDSDDQKEQLRRYRMSEDSDLFKQRVRISNPATCAPLETCYSYISQVWRTDGVKKTVTINSETAKRIIEAAVRHVLRAHGFARIYVYAGATRQRVRP